MNLAQAKALLPEIRDVIGMASEEFAETYNVNTGMMQICSREGVEVFPILTLEKSISTDDRELIRKAPVYVRALLMLRDEAVKEWRKIAPQPPQPASQKRKTTDANRCAIMCHNDRAFRVWLMECKGLHDAGDAERIKTHVRFLLAVDSLSKIDTNPKATQAWRQMRAEFDAWRRTG